MSELIELKKIYVCSLCGYTSEVKLEICTGCGYNYKDQKFAFGPLTYKTVKGEQNETGRNVQ